MKKALSMLLAGTMAMSLVACSSGNSALPPLQTPQQLQQRTPSQRVETPAADTSEDYGDYS